MPLRSWRSLAVSTRPTPSPAPRLSARAAASPASRIGILKADQREFFGDQAASDLYDAALERASALGAELVEVDLAPFLVAAELLYAGPWVAERTAAVGEFLAARPDAFWPTTRAVIETGRRFSAVDAFTGQYRLAELARAAATVWGKVDVLLLPTTPTIYRVDELAAEPILLNSRLGTYTNFVNLLDLCALALPGGFRPDGMPLGITLMAPAWHDRMLAGLGQAWQRATGLPLGASGATLPDEPDVGLPGSHEVELAVVGAHLSGGPLNHELLSADARLLRTTRTANCYRLYALAGTQPPKPGMVRGPGEAGDGIEVEVWALPVPAFGALVARIPPPLAIGTVELADGSRVKGFLCEDHAVDAAGDITAHGGWRAYLGSVAATTRRPDGLDAAALLAMLHPAVEGAADAADVAAHRLLGGRAVAGPDRLEQDPVLGRRIVRPAAQAELGARQRRQLAPQYPGGLGQKAVVGALVDRGVERHVGGVNGLDVVGTAQRRVAPGEGRLEPLPLRARHLAGRQPGADRLDLLHGLEQLGQPGRLQARDDRAAMRPQLDQIHGRQLLERLAHRRARHGKALRHRHLVQPLPRRQLAAHDRLGDGVPQRIGPCAPRLDRPGPDLFQNRSPARGKPGLCRRVADRVNGSAGVIRCYGPCLAASSALLRKLTQRPLQTLGHLRPCGVPRGWATGAAIDHFAVGRQCLELAERRRVPCDLADDDRDDAGLLRLVPLQRPLHLDVVAVVRAHEVGADQEQDQVGALQVLVDLALPFAAARDAAIGPELQHPGAIEELEVRLQLRPQTVVLVRVADERLQRPVDRLPCIGGTSATLRYRHRRASP